MQSILLSPPHVTKSSAGAGALGSLEGDACRHSDGSSPLYRPASYSLSQGFAAFQLAPNREEEEVRREPGQINKASRGTEVRESLFEGHTHSASLAQHFNKALWDT